MQRKQNKNNALISKYVSESTYKRNMVATILSVVSELTNTNISSCRLNCSY